MEDHVTLHPVTSSSIALYHLGAGVGCEVSGTQPPICDVNNNSYPLIITDVIIC